jgi:hypothetical protein
MSCCGQNAIHVHRVTVPLNDYDAFGARSDCRLNQSWACTPAESTKTGRPLQYVTVLAVATRVRVGTMTSSQGRTPSAIIAWCDAAVINSVPDGAEIFEGKLELFNILASL